MAPQHYTNLTRRLGQQSGVVRGIAWMLVSGVLFVVVTVIVRYLGSDLPAAQSAFIRYAFGIVLLLPVILRVLRTPPSSQALLLYAGRGVAHGVGVILWFYAMARVPIAEVTSLGFLTPVFVTVGAALFLGEKLHMRRIGGILCALAGALIILRPGFTEINLAHWAQVLAAPCFALSYLLTKRFTRSASADEIVTMLTLFCTAALLPAALLQWQTPALADWFWLFVTAIAATLGHYSMTRALHAAPISLLQPFTFLQLVWATLAGLVLFGEEPELAVFIGATLIVAATSYISHREYQLQKKE